MPYLKLCIVFYVFECFVCMYVHREHTWTPERSEESVRSHENEVAAVMSHHVGAES